MADTSIGPGDSKPTEANAGAKAPATIGKVDAQQANEFDIRHGLAGAEAKPFSKASRAPGLGSQESHDHSRNHEAASSQPADELNRSEPNKRSDLVSERRNPGAEGIASSPESKK